MAWQGKLTGQITASNALTFSAQADPFTGDRPRLLGRRRGPPGADRRRPRPTTARGRASGRRATRASSVRTSRPRRPTRSSAAASSSSSYSRRRLAVLQPDRRPRLQRRRLRGQRRAAAQPGQRAPSTTSRRSGATPTTSRSAWTTRTIESVNSYIYPGNQLFVVTDFDPVAHQPILSPGDQWFQFTHARAVHLDRHDLGHLRPRPLRPDRPPLLQPRRARRHPDAPRATSQHVRRRDDHRAAALRGLRHLRRRQDAALGRLGPLLRVPRPDDRRLDLQRRAAGVATRRLQLDRHEWAFDYPIRAGGNDQPVNPNLKPSLRRRVQPRASSSRSATRWPSRVRGVYRKWNDIVDDIKLLDAGRRTRSDADQLQQRHHRPQVQVDRAHVQQAVLEQLPGPRELHAVRRRPATPTARTSLVAFTSQLLDYPERHLHRRLRPANKPAVSGPCPEILGHNRGGPLPWDVTNSVKIYAAYTYPDRRS